MKILVADKLAPAGLEFLRAQAGYTVVDAAGSTPAQLLALAPGSNAIIVRSASTITAEIMAAALPALKVIGRAGVGVDNIDVEAATQHGVIVLNTPDGNTIATTELSFTHLLCTARPIAQAAASMRAGQWDKKSFSGIELHGKTLGVLGLGRIGSGMARRAKAFGMRVLSFDPYVTADRALALDTEPCPLEQLLAEADFITVHMPKTEVTANLLCAAAIQKMKRGVRLINCARGGLIDEQALIEALRSGQVASAGLDVYEEEPLPADSELRRLPNVVLTPHLGASTAEAQEGVGLQVAQSVVEVLQGGMARNAVNMPAIDPAALQLLRPYLTLGEQLGSVLQQIAPGAVTRLAITYLGKIVEIDAMPVTRAIQKGYLRAIKGPGVNDVNAPLHIKRLGIEIHIVKSNQESDYTEMIRVEATGADGAKSNLEGTLLGKSQRPRVVGINGYEVESSLDRLLLLVSHRDVLGMVGMVGTVLARHQVNIANMSLGRTVLGGVVLTVLELDNPPPAEALAEIKRHEAVTRVQLVTV